MIIKFIFLVIIRWKFGTSRNWGLNVKLKWKQYIFQQLGGFWRDPFLWGCIKIFLKNCGKYLIWYLNVHVIKTQYLSIFNNDLLNILSCRIELHMRDSVWLGGFLKGTTISVFGSGRTGSDGIAVWPQASSGVWGPSGVCYLDCLTTSEPEGGSLWRHEGT